MLELLAVSVSENIAPVDAAFIIVAAESVIYTLPVVFAERFAAFTASAVGVAVASIAPEPDDKTTVPPLPTPLLSA